MKILDEVQLIDGNDSTDWVAFNVTDAVYGSITLVPSDSWGTADFYVKRSADGTKINAKNFATAITLNSSTPYAHDLDLSSVEWLVVEVNTAEGSALRLHANFNGKGDE